MDQKVHISSGRYYRKFSGKYIYFYIDLVIVNFRLELSEISIKNTKSIN